MSLASLAETHTLKAGSTLTLQVPSKDVQFLVVQNQGIDTFISATTSNGETIAKSESWRGREGRYLLALFDEAGTLASQVTIQNGGEHIPDGTITVQWLAVRPQSTKFNALRLTASGFSLHAFGEREAAINAYEQALAMFTGTGVEDWAADIQYELGYLNQRLGNLQLAEKAYNRALNLYQAQYHQRGEALSHNALGIVAWLSGQQDKALEYYEEALALRQSLGEPFHIAQTVNNIGLVEWSLDNYEAAAASLQQAIVLLSQSQSPAPGNATQEEISQIIRITNNLALVRSSMGETTEAEALWMTALQQSKAIDGNFRTAVIQTNLGKMLAEQGQLEDALSYLGAASDYFRETDNDAWLAETMMGVGVVYASVEEDHRALSIYQRALDKSGETQQLQASLFSLMAKANHRLGHLDTAQERFEAAQASFIAADQLSQAAVVKSEQAMLLHQQGQPALALQTQQQAISTLQDLGVLREAARAQSRLGYMLLAEGRKDEAQEALNIALEGHKAVSDELYELDTLTALSRAQTGTVALETAKTATNLAGNIRARTQTTELQMSLLASRRQAFERHINLLVDAGDVAQAWQVSENIRARSLLDLVQNASDRDVMALLTANTMLDLKADQAMVSYFLGENRSHLWVMSSDKLLHYPLPPATQINTHAAELAVSLHDYRQSPTKIAWLAEQLGQQVLMPAWNEIADKDLIVMADGGLQTIPFSLLTSSDRTTHTTITYSPSARLFNLLRDRSSGQGEGLVVLADPLEGVEIQDEFADPITQFSHLVAQRSVDQVGINLSTLPGAKLEAAAIADLTKATLLTGQSVNHDWVIQGGLNHYGIVHFATHGVVDADMPALSGLVLATENNVPRYLRAHEIASLNLQADLVVLSACETGIGQSIAGEGLMSLSRPFFVAGAKQVIASLWKVSDRATAILMERFYFHLLEQQQSPKNALHSAQTWMQSQPEWSHPNFWAGFILQG